MISPQANAKPQTPARVNELLNESEIAGKNTVLQCKPKRLGVTLTTVCNLKCVMCNVTEVPWEISERTAQEVARYFPYLEFIFWLGGEVFLSRQFEALFDGAAASPQLTQSIVTSGVLIDDKWARKIAQARTILTLSIDAFSKEPYESIRVGARFERLLQGIAYLNKYRSPGSYLGINFTTMRQNYREIAHAVDFAHRNAFTAVTINLIDEDGDPLEGFPYKDLQAVREMEAMLPDLYAAAKAHAIDLKVFLPLVKLPLAKSEDSPKYGDGSNSSRSSDGLLCHLPWQYLFIGAGGKVKPYCLCREDIGDVNQSSLDDIWNNAGMQLYRQKVINNECKGFCNLRCTDGVIPESELKFPAWRDRTPSDVSSDKPTLPDLP